MRKLISLEIRRTPLKTYILAALWVALGVGALAGLMAAIPAVSAAMGEPMDGDDLLLFSRWDTLLPVVGVLNMAAFAIFAGVMGSKFVISEYAGERAVLLLSYPTSRRAVLWSKCILVFGFSTLAALLCFLAVTAELILCSGLSSLVAQPFAEEQLGYALGLSLCLALLSGAVGLLALPFGFQKGSVASAIVAAVVLACLCAQALSALGSVPVMAAAAGVLLLLALLSVRRLAGRVDRMEAL